MGRELDIFFPEGISQYVLLNEGNLAIDELGLVGKKRPDLYGDSYKLRKRASEAFSEMRKDAQKNGIEIYSVSSYRSFNHQKRIWNNKFQKYTAKEVSPEQAIEEIIKYSAIPGTSRHHWGTDVDAIDISKPQPRDVLQARNFKKGGAFEELGEWLSANANKYGYWEVYTENLERKGFKPEPWHFSFAELSMPILKIFTGISLENYLIDETVKGSNLFSSSFLRQYKNDFILGINPQLISSPAPHSSSSGN